MLVLVFTSVASRWRQVWHIVAVLHVPANLKVILNLRPQMLSFQEHASSENQGYFSLQMLEFLCHQVPQHIWHLLQSEKLAFLLEIFAVTPFSMPRLPKNALGNF